MFRNGFGTPIMNMPMQEDMIDITNNKGTIDIDVNQSSMFGPMTSPSMGCQQQPIIEPMQERVVQRTIVHNVAHVCPIRTKIINNHVYKHTYQPSYSCCEENVVSNVNDGGCGCNLK